MPVCTIYRTKGASFYGREWGEVMGSRKSSGEGAGSGEEGVAGLAGEVVGYVVSSGGGGGFCGGGGTRARVFAGVGGGGIVGVVGCGGVEQKRGRMELQVVAGNKDVNSVFERGGKQGYGCEILHSWSLVLVGTFYESPYGL
uniref:Uncharacterized protein n=1 Tax=Tanacetum cinerariifolium TaxID=118510 RepID=A0A6L2NHX4_TANCI|nr:hypothetical protein [Tanacetum cinerariifolium]